MDLAEFFDGRRSWHELRYFIDHAPQGSHLWSANVGDKDMARALLELNDYKIPRSSHVPLEGYSDIAQALLDIKDLLTIQVTGGGKNFTPSPRPETAVESVQREIKERKMGTLEAMLT